VILNGAGWSGIVESIAILLLFAAAAAVLSVRLFRLDAPKASWA